MKIVPPIKIHGGKSYLSKKIWELMPPHIHRVHPYGGGFNDGWNWPYEGVSEVYNDLDRRLTNFFRVLQNEKLFVMFQRKVEAIPFSQREWKVNNELCRELGWNGNIPDEGLVMRAVNFFVNVRQSLAGRMDSFAPLSKNRTRRGMNEQASAWLNAVDGLPAVHSRLRRVVILNDEATKVIEREDSKNTLFVCDPPYYPDTCTAPDVYNFEMRRDQHAYLLEVLANIQGKFILSGYDNDLYRSYEETLGWKRHEVELANHAAGGNSKRRMVEVLWKNY